MFRLVLISLGMVAWVELALPAIAALIPAVKGAQCPEYMATVPSTFKMRRR